MKCLDVILGKPEPLTQPYSRILIGILLKARKWGPRSKMVASKVVVGDHDT